MFRPKNLFDYLEQIDYPRYKEVKGIKVEKYSTSVDKKTQIYLHHTVSGAGITGDIEHWKKANFALGTFCIIGADKIYQLFHSFYAAHHLGIKKEIFTQRGLKPINHQLNYQSIGIEIDSWGQIVKSKDRYYNVYGGRVSAKEVHELENPFKVYSNTPYTKKVNVQGKPCKYYHKYTDKQIEMLKVLLLYLSNKYSIDISYKEDIWDVTNRALKGERGLFTHNSVRPDKSDVFPYPPLIKMLKTL